MKFDKTRIRLLLGLGLILSAFGYLFFSGMEASQVYYLTVDEYQERAASLSPDEPFRVSGRVEPDSVILAENGMDLQFTVYDPEIKHATLAVSYHGVVPDTFMENSEVVVEGTIQGDVFQAHTLLAKCPSKYEALTDELADEETAKEAEAAGHPAGSDT
jgi:cytochrome c-type biogenesis protein CcmE